MFIFNPLRPLGTALGIPRPPGLYPGLFNRVFNPSIINGPTLPSFRNFSYGFNPNFLNPGLFSYHNMTSPRFCFPNFCSGRNPLNWRPTHNNCDPIANLFPPLGPYAYNNCDPFANSFPLNCFNPPSILDPVTNQLLANSETLLRAADLYMANHMLRENQSAGQMFNDLLMNQMNEFLSLSNNPTAFYSNPHGLNHLTNRAASPFLHHIPTHAGTSNYPIGFGQITTG